jgi:methylated-DNA-protein-cysteine methyltransferase-like protein
MAGKPSPSPSQNTRISARVLALVAEVPRGRVTTYGAVAEALDIGPRQVAYVLASESRAGDVPWYRVVGAGGRLTIPDDQHRAEQARRLAREGVKLIDRKVQRFSEVFFAP